jgi:hypothetical protein
MGLFNLFIESIVPLDVDIEITGLTPSANLTTITNVITSFIYEIRPFIDGADDLSTINNKLYEADIYRIVRDNLSAGESFTIFTMSVDGTPERVYLFDDGNIPYLNSVTSV